jgi:drug/metabolite transporter (DMT)-like permease
MTARGWILFAAVSVVWGVPYLFIKLAVEDLSPGFMAWARVALAALVLLPVAWQRGALRGLPLRWLTAFALFEITIPFPLIAFGEQRVSSSLAAILIAAVPLVVAFLALRFDPAEQPSPRRFVGMLIGLGGVIALVGIDIGGRGSELVGAAAILTATFGYACGPLIAKRHLTAVDPLGPVAGALGIASIMLLPFAIGGFPTELPTGQATASVAVLGLVCTAFAFLIFFRLIAEVGPSRASIITYVNPIVALALGVAILGESVTAGAIAGLLLILAGSWLSTDGRLPPGLVALATRLRGRRGRSAAAGPERIQLTSGGTILSTSPLTRSKIASARSRWSRSCVAITDVRSNAPPRCTAG